MDRELLEKEVLAEVCVCRYYDLADMLYEAPDDDLLAIVKHMNACDICDN